MPRYEVEFDAADEPVLKGAAEERGLSVPDFIRGTIVKLLEEHRGQRISDEFRRLVEASFEENEPVLRRLAA